MPCAETKAFTSTDPRDGKALRSHLDGFFLSAIIQVPTSWFLPYVIITFIDFFRWVHIYINIYFKRKLCIIAINGKLGSPVLKTIKINETK